MEQGKQESRKEVEEAVAEAKAGGRVSSLALVHAMRTFAWRTAMKEEATPAELEAMTRVFEMAFPERARCSLGRAD